MLEFNPINPLAAKAPWLINNRDHRKLLVVDGRIAFIGGINISSVYSSGSVARRTGKSAGNTVAWRDTDLQIEGPVVAELQKLFLETWEKQRGKPLAEKDYFPALDRAGEGHRARHRQHARRPLQPDLPDADLGHRQCRKTGAS